METYLILMVISLSLFAIISVITVLDCPDEYLKNPPFSSEYPLSYRLRLEHSWCRKVAKIALIFATILWFIFPIFADNLSGGEYFVTYIFLAVGWYIGQIIIYVICVLILLILNFIWELLKELYEWLKE